MTAAPYFAKMNDDRTESPLVVNSTSVKLESNGWKIYLFAPQELIYKAFLNLMMQLAEADDRQLPPPSFSLSTAMKAS